MGMMKSIRGEPILIKAVMMDGVQMENTHVKRKLHIHSAMILEFTRSIDTMMMTVNLVAGAGTLKMHVEF